ncbi:MAG: tetratricopeptide repeat protein [Nostoc sp. CmiVER01]|uniref:tetratricopeptide repeat protein n=1 Tax=Nostoc sp. CmiVER01 TaxID=3075384 RepID=UPI002AD3107D|nr:tetratricopeptide repeat protein [Nostoc sp. CmiVER01]MDZ8122082.1 tetratricopeptide repeat protein [Nostoc sp. CmiVER01]
MTVNNHNKNINPDQKNQDAFDDLIVSIEAGEGKFNLLIGVCDNADFRNQIIDRYETELKPHFCTYTVTIDEKEPNLKAAIQQLLEKEECLQHFQPAVITVTGAEKLLFLRLGEEQSPQEKFFGYLQWTREGLGKFPFAIVLWVTHQVMINLMKKAPDFWSWRNGVFRFVSHAKNVISAKEVEAIRFALTSTELENFNSDNDYFLPIEDLQRLIQQIEQQSEIKDAKLASLYVTLTNIYKQRLNRGEAQDYQQELDLAIKYIYKALELQKELGLEEDVATSYNNLASLYESQGRYNEAEPLFIQALALRRQLLGDEHPDVATSLNNLALLYASQGRYSEAEPLYIQVLALLRQLLGDEHPDVATSLNNLASLYDSQGRYSEAELLYIQALALRRQLLGDEHPSVATSLNNLALLYASQGRDSEAEPLYIRALALLRQLLGDEHPSVATSLNNLASLYNSQGRYSEAELLYIQALALLRQLLGDEHPDVATSLNNLAYFYDSQGRYSEAEPLFIQALALRRQLLGDEHPDVAQSLNNLAGLYDSQGRYLEAEPLYQKALQIAELSLGVNHPNTITIRENLKLLRDRA